MRSFTRPPFNLWVLLLSLPLYCPRQTSHPHLLLLNLCLLVLFTTTLITIMTDDVFLQVNVTIFIVVKDTSLLIVLIFRVLMGLQTTTKGRESGSKTRGLITLHNGLMSSVKYAIPSVTQPPNVLNFKTTNDNLVSVLRWAIFSPQTMWIGFLTLVQINTSHLILKSNGVRTISRWWSLACWWW